MVASSKSKSESKSAVETVSFDPWLLWVTFRRCWLWGIPVGLVLAGIASYFVYDNFVPEYRATHILEANRDYVLFEGVIASRNDLSRVESQLLTNSLVLDPVLADSLVCEAPSLRDPTTRDRNLRERLTIGDAGTKQLLTVSYQDPDPEYAALVCNTIVDSYLRQRQSFDNQRISDLEGWLRPAIDRWENEVSGHQQRVRQLSQQARGFDPFREVTEVESGTATMTSLFNQLTSIKGDEEVLRAQLEAETSRLEEDPTGVRILAVDPTPVEIEQFVANDNKVGLLRTRHAQKREQLSRMEDSDLVRINRGWYNTLQDDLAKLAREQEKEEGRAREDAVVFLREQSRNQALAERSRRIATMQGELEGLISKRQTLEKSFGKEKVRLEQYAGETVDLYFAQQQYNQAAAILEKLNMRIASLRTERQKGASMQTLAKATPPAVPIEEIPWKTIILVGGGAFAIPFLVALLVEFTAKRVSTADAIESQQLTPVLGEVARLPTNAAVGAKRRVFEESVDSLRVNFLMSRDVEQSRSIAVTSSIAGEGKSSLVSQLAISIARSTGETVLLIDADLRSPDQHHLFGIPLGPGLSQVLAGRVKLDNAIDRSLNGLVHVLPAGYLDASPHRILNATGVKRLLDEALNDIGYRYVLFDTAPVLAAGESLSVTAEVDATLLCVMRDVSRLATVRRTVKRLQLTGTALAGVVFNGVPSRQYAYRYGDYHYGDTVMESDGYAPVES
jgi:polysaccharide biosynthesis transport protein